MNKYEEAALAAQEFSRQGLSVENIKLATDAAIKIAELSRIIIENSIDSSRNDKNLNQE